MRTRLRERLLAGLGAAGVVALLLYALLVGLTLGFERRRERALVLVELAPPPAPKLRVERRPRRAAAAAAAPRNLKRQPTEIVAPPPPPLLLPPPPPVIAAPVAGAGAAVAAGASDRPGPGQGAGGEGNGAGGGTGVGDDDVPPRLLRGRLTFADLPPALREAGVGGTVAVRYHVEPDGSVRDCIATRSSGSAELDALTCRLIAARFRYDPSRRPDGRPVRSTIEESHSWIIDRTSYARPGE